MLSRYFPHKKPASTQKPPLTPSPRACKGAEELPHRGAATVLPPGAIPACHHGPCAFRYKSCLCLLTKHIKHTRHLAHLTRALPLHTQVCRFGDFKQNKGAIGLSAKWLRGCWSALQTPGQSGGCSPGLTPRPGLRWPLPSAWLSWSKARELLPQHASQSPGRLRHTQCWAFPELRVH